MRRLFLPLLVTAAAAAAPASAQSPSAPSLPGGPDAALQAGDAARDALRPEQALAIYLELLAEDPVWYAALWRAARESVSLGMLATESDERKALYAEAEGYARRARAANPLGVEGAEWLAVALGRQALEQGPRGRVRYAVEVRDVAREALALDPASAAAHHVLGAWNAEVRRLSGVERWVARKLLGGAVLEEASWEAAETHLEQAVALDPTDLIHRLELARVLLDTGRPDAAEPHLRGVLEEATRDPADPLHKEEARRLLHGIR